MRARTVAPSPSKCLTAASATRSACSNAAAVGSTTTSVPPLASRSCVSNWPQAGRNSPPPTSASVPGARLAVMAAQPTHCLSPAVVDVHVPYARIDRPSAPLWQPAGPALLLVGSLLASVTTSGGGRPWLSSGSGSLDPG